MLQSALNPALRAQRQRTVLPFMAPRLAGGERQGGQDVRRQELLRAGKRAWLRRFEVRNACVKPAVSTPSEYLHAQACGGKVHSSKKYRESRKVRAKFMSDTTVWSSRTRSRGGTSVILQSDGRRH